jgi:hypothetical protein
MERGRTRLFKWIRTKKLTEKDEDKDEDKTRPMTRTMIRARKRKGQVRIQEQDNKL